MSKARRDKRKFRFQYVKDGVWKSTLPGRKGRQALVKALSSGEIGIIPTHVTFIVDGIVQCK